MTINRELLEVFRQNFKAGVSEKGRLIGMEGEFPVVYHSGEAVGVDVIQGMFPYLKEQGFELERDKSSGEVIAARKSNEWGQGRFAFHKDVIGTDIGYPIIEVSLTPSENLALLDQHLSNVIEMLVAYFDKQGALILGYGVQPISPPSKRLMAQKEKYILYEYFSSNRFIDQRDGFDYHFLTLSASNQCHIDIELDEAIRAVNVLNGLAGLQIALCANSPIWKGQVDSQWKAVREIFWEYSFPNYCHQVGIPPKFRDDVHYIEYLCDFAPMAIKRDGQTIRLIDKRTFMDFLLSEEGALGSLVNQEKVLLYPKWDDIYYHSGFARFNARLAPAYGTVEARVYCQQPPHETMSTHALTLGIIENLGRAETLLAEFSWPEWQKLRFDALRHTQRAKIGNQAITPLLSELLQIAEAGLQKRGLNEEQFLAPLFERLDSQTAPADKAIKLFKSEGLQALLQRLSF